MTERIRIEANKSARERTRLWHIFAAAVIIAFIANAYPALSLEQPARPQGSDVASTGASQLQTQILPSATNAPATTSVSAAPGPSFSSPQQPTPYSNAASAQADMALAEKLTQVGTAITNTVATGQYWVTVFLMTVTVVTVVMGAINLAQVHLANISVQRELKKWEEQNEYKIGKFETDISDKLKSVVAGYQLEVDRALRQLSSDLQIGIADIAQDLYDSAQTAIGAAPESRSEADDFFRNAVLAVYEVTAIAHRLASSSPLQVPGHRPHPGDLVALTNNTRFVALLWSYTKRDQVTTTAMRKLLSALIAMRQYQPPAGDDPTLATLSVFLAQLNAKAANPLDRRGSAVLPDSPGF